MAKFDNSRGGFDASILPRRRRRQEEHKQSIFTWGSEIGGGWPGLATFRRQRLSPTKPRLNPGRLSPPRETRHGSARDRRGFAEPQPRPRCRFAVCSRQVTRYDAIWWKRINGSHKETALFVATKKQLLNRWLEEPGRTIAARIREILIDYADKLIPLGWKAHEQTGLYIIPREWLPHFDTKVIFDLLAQLPFRDEVANGRDLRGLASIGGCPEWDLRNTDFSYLPKTEGHRFDECYLDGSIFDASDGDFDFLRCPLRKVRFRKVHFRPTRFRGGFCAGDCLECDFSNAKMKKATFLGNANLQGSVFVEADLTWANLTGCDLRSCDFRGANLANAAIDESIIDSTTDFRGANLVGLSWRDNSGKLFKRGSDWRRGKHDSSTTHD